MAKSVAERKREQRGRDREKSRNVTGDVTKAVTMSRNVTEAVTMDVTEEVEDLKRAVIALNRRVSALENVVEFREAEIVADPEADEVVMRNQAKLAELMKRGLVKKGWN